MDGMLSPTVWEGLYESLTDINNAIEIAQEEENTKMEGALMVMQAWIFSQLTNAYGDIPYSEAIDGLNANFTPVYDTQESIYTDLLARLTQATTKLGAAGSIEGDILYQGDATLWAKFANSLSLRLLMYASEKQMFQLNSRKSLLKVKSFQVMRSKPPLISCPAFLINSLLYL